MPDFSIVYVLVNPAMPGLVKSAEIRGYSPRVLRELLVAWSLNSCEPIDPSAPKGQKEIAQGSAKRRPGYACATGALDRSP